MHLNINKKRFARIMVVILTVTLLVAIFCPMIASAATADPAATLDPSSTADAVPQSEPRGCWSWGPGKLFLVSSVVILPIAILMALIQAKRKFKD